ncbi:MAG: acyl-CoA dehydratase activase-related protein [candidate division WOR-3 bacterium]
MPKKIGIARALYSYYHFHLFKTFFENLGASVIISPPTSKAILKLGIENSPAEICLPVKAFLGHIYYLKDKVDYLFLPRIVCIKRDKRLRFGCPKAIGLPDLIKATFKNLPPILELIWDERIKPLMDSFFTIARILGKDKRVANYAYEEGLKAQSLNNQLLLAGLTPDQIFETKLENLPIDNPKNNATIFEPVLSNFTPHSLPVVGIVGHPYLLFDPELSLGVIDHLKSLGISVLTPTMLSPSTIQNSITMVEELSWIYEQEILGSAIHFLQNQSVDGLLLISSFACGTSAVVNEIIVHEIACNASVPLLTLLLDEHTSKTGLVTRLESFVDLITLKKRKPFETNSASMLSYAPILR